MTERVDKELDLLWAITDLAKAAREMGMSRRRFRRQLRKMHRESMKNSPFGTMNKQVMRVMIDSMLEIAWPVGT